MSILKLRFHSDPGHGWLEVSKELLAQLDIADKITSYSYALDTVVYLEEDCDMSLFLEAAAKAEITINFIQVYYRDYCAIRDYPSYRQAIDRIDLT